MKKLSHDEFVAWSEAAKVLEKDRYGVKVLHLADGTFLKLFRRKSWLSKTTFFPPPSVSRPMLPSSIGSASAALLCWLCIT